jgi:hypothetical protein
VLKKGADSRNIGWQRHSIVALTPVDEQAYIDEIGLEG